MQPDDAERAAKILILAEDLQRTEVRGREVRASMRVGLDELDRLASAREELERRIQALLDGGESSEPSEEDQGPGMG